MREPSRGSAGSEEEDCARLQREYKCAAREYRGVGEAWFYAGVYRAAGGGEEPSDVDTGRGAGGGARAGAGVLDRRRWRRASGVGGAGARVWRREAGAVLGAADGYGAVLFCRRCVCHEFGVGGVADVAVAGYVVR